MKKRHLALLAGLFLSCVFIYIIMKSVDIKMMAHYYSKMNFFWLLPFAAIVLIQLFVRALKWRLMLLSVVKPKLMDVFKIETAGLAINNVLPFRIGEIVRALIAAKMFKVSAVSVFSTIVLERIVDTLGIMILFGVFSFSDGFLTGMISPSFFLYFTIFAIGLAAFAFFLPSFLQSVWFARFFFKAPKIKEFLIKAVDGLKSVKNPIRGLAMLILAVVQWLLESLNNYIFAIAFGLGYVINFAKGVLILCFAAFGVSLPSMPGYFGNFEFAVMKILSLWNVPKDISAAYAWALHLSGYVVITGLGLFFVYSLGYSLGQVMDMGKKEKI